MEPAERQLALLMDTNILLNIFQYLNTSDLLKCRVVCKEWDRISRDKKFTTIMDLSGLKITANMITMAANMKPDAMVLDWTNIGKQQLSWLLPKVQSLKYLSLAGLEFSSQVCVLSSPTSPMLTELNLSFVTSLTDAAVNKLLVLADGKKSNLVNLRRLTLNNTEISDISLRLVIALIGITVFLSL